MIRELSTASSGAATTGAVELAGTSNGAEASRAAVSRARRLRVIAISAAALLAASCVYLTPAGAQIELATAVPPGCEKVGQVQASVRDRVIFDRSVARVLTEIRTLARNEAARLDPPGDTLVATSGLVRSGTTSAQQFDLYRCR